MISKRGKKPWWSPEELGGQKARKKMSRRCCEDDGVVEVHRWLTEVPYDVLNGVAKACKEGRLEEEDLPQWTKNAVGEIKSQAFDDDEAHNIYMKSFLCRSADFLIHFVWRN